MTLKYKEKIEIMERLMVLTKSFLHKNDYL